MTDAPRPALARVAHDVRGQAGLVKGALDELVRALGPAATDHAGLVRIADRGIRQLVALADRCAAAASLASGNGESKMTVDFVPIVVGAMELADATVGKRSVTVRAEIPATMRGEGNTRILSAALTETVAIAVRAARTSVVVSLQARDGQAVVQCAADAVRIPALDESDELGFGLARAAAKMHGGQLLVTEEAPGLLLTFTLGATA